MNNKSNKTYKINKSSLKSILSLGFEYKTNLILAILFLFFGTAITLIFPYYVKMALNPGSSIYLLNFPYKSFFVFFILFSIQGVLFYFRTLLFMFLASKIVFSLKTAIFKNILSQEISFFDSANVNDLVSRITNDTLLIKDLYSTRLSVILRYSIQVIIGIIMMCIISLRLTLLLVAILLALVGFSFFLGKKLKSYTHKIQTSYGSISFISEESFSGIRVLKAFDGINNTIKRFTEKATAIYDLSLQRAKISAFFQSFVSSLLNISLIGILVYASVLTSQGKMSIGDITSFCIYSAIVAVSFSFISSNFSEVAQAVGVVDRIFGFTKNEPTSENLIKDLGVKLETTLPLNIKFDDVSFLYPSRPETLVLSDLTFEIKAGAITGIVGASGAGKTALINLILKFYSPNKGVISINNKDIKEIDNLTLTQLVSYVPQDSFLFGVSIKDNLTLGNPSISEQDINKILIKLDLLDFIESLPLKIDTITGEKGVQISGGQKQRLAIARSILRKPEILILDEATSALDSFSEANVILTISEYMAEKTVIIIAHRFSSLKKVNTVLVLEDGKLKQEGSVEQLKNLDGIYKDLFSLQQLI